MATIQVGATGLTGAQAQAKAKEHGLVNVRPSANGKFWVATDPATGASYSVGPVAAGGALTNPGRISGPGRSPTGPARPPQGSIVPGLMGADLGIWEWIKRQIRELMETIRQLWPNVPSWLWLALAGLLLMLLLLSRGGGGQGVTVNLSRSRRR